MSVSEKPKGYSDSLTQWGEQNTQFCYLTNSQASLGWGETPPGRLPLPS